jgi:hypothetical protein
LWEKGEKKEERKKKKMASDMEAAAKLFFSSPRFAVAGASNDVRKFGYKSRFFDLSTIILTFL